MESLRLHRNSRGRLPALSLISWTHPFNVLIVGFVFLLLVANRISRVRAFTLSSVQTGSKTNKKSFPPTDVIPALHEEQNSVWFICIPTYLLLGDVTPEINKLPRNSRIFSCLRGFGNNGDQPRFLIYYCLSYFWSPDWPPAAAAIHHNTVMCKRRVTDQKQQQRNKKSTRQQLQLGPPSSLLLLHFG